jgi:hypothetical protein
MPQPISGLPSDLTSRAGHTSWPLQVKQCGGF